MMYCEQNDFLHNFLVLLCVTYKVLSAEICLAFSCQIRLFTTTGDSFNYRILWGHFGQYLLTDVFQNLIVIMYESFVSFNTRLADVFACTMAHMLYSLLSLYNVLHIQKPLTGRRINAKAIEQYWESDTG